MRKHAVVFAAVVLILAGGLIALLGPRHCPVNRAAFGRIEEAMRRAEVYAILGGPPGDYRTRPHAAPALRPFGPSNLALVFDRGGSMSMRDRLPLKTTVEEWEGDEGTAWVYFDPTDDRMIEVLFHDAEPHAFGVVELARWRLRKLEAWLP